ncbi:hypothetical protein J6590_107117 [Homalodisca vitripennis]|nr:hypothetical protein J6590_107117 [Homalodisca vitripennis]
MPSAHSVLITDCQLFINDFHSVAGGGKCPLSNCDHQLISQFYVSYRANQTYPTVKRSLKSGISADLLADHLHGIARFLNTAVFKLVRVKANDQLLYHLAGKPPTGTQFQKLRLVSDSGLCKPKSRLDCTTTVMIHNTVIMTSSGIPSAVSHIIGSQLA